MRGLDLSGSLQGAGGAGGLLAVSFATNGTHFAAFDGNGNVAGLVNAADGTLSANYEYGPFGEAVRMTGPVSKLSPIRFSTQFADDVTGDLKYLYRNYNPSTGNWPSRDPIKELAFGQFFKKESKQLSGSQNIYGFVNNNSVNKFDITGLSPDCCCDTKKVTDGYKVLKDRWLSAAKYLDAHGIVLDPYGLKGASCLDSANHILNAMSPTPPCWLCYIQTRMNPDQGGWNENSIRCDSVSPKAANYHIVFDYWHQKDIGSKTYEPYQASIYDQEFPISLPTDPSGFYTYHNFAPHDDCDGNSYFKNNPTYWLTPLLP
jgi:RHS repeat-associated protein